MSSTIRIAGVDYPGVPSVTLKDPGGNSIAFPDVSGDTVTAATLRAGVTAHAADGSQIEGSYVPSYADAYDSLWQSFTPDRDYRIPLLTGDLSGALRIDISALGYAPRITMLRPANNTASLVATASSETQYRLIWAIAFFDAQGASQSGMRGGVAAVIYPDSNKCGGTSNANIGLYPVGTDLVLACTTFNAIAQNGVLKSANWQWRVIA